MFGFERNRNGAGIAEPEMAPGAGKDASEVAAALHAVFEREAAALRNGDFDGLVPILADKERLAEALAAASVAPETARRLQAQAVRNGTLLEAARAGLQDGARRLGMLTAPAMPLQTYDDRGRRASLDGAGARPGRRA